MASFEKMADGRTRAFVARKGRRVSKILPSKRAAKDWAARQEYLILNEEVVKASGTFGDMLKRYADEVSIHKSGARWEIVRIDKLRRDRVADVALMDLRPADLASWRDRRLREVSPASVNREMVLMGAALSVARKEWGLIKVNPMSDVTKPSKPPPRDRLVSQDELARLRISAGEDLAHATARSFHAFLFAIETAMRAGELSRLEWGDIDLVSRVARLHKTKNGYPRDVPLSKEAVRLLEALPRMTPAFGLTADQVSVLFAKVRRRAGINGLTFHDSRHEAITRLAKKLDVLALARMVGHRDLRQLSVYYNETAAELAKRLD
ncbi:site-specific integrase [Sulfitobacter sp. 20_GPM-1509m]|uniref:tyrosine-type recombinase/integrase n=1 Tax=Sulfitobacter sp. 20_GPM-1509m TaxID=1380367 RepID=UPI00048CB029|nr:site-specific integrase [Sulfitobacter sp. 20_GPM-1509m]